MRSQFPFFGISWWSPLVPKRDEEGSSAKKSPSNKRRSEPQKNVSKCPPLPGDLCSLALSRFQDCSLEDGKKVASKNRGWKWWTKDFLKPNFSNIDCKLGKGKFCCIRLCYVICILEDCWTVGLLALGLQTHSQQVAFMVPWLGDGRHSFVNTTTQAIVFPRVLGINMSGLSKIVVPKWL